MTEKPVQTDTKYFSFLEEMPIDGWYNIRELEDEMDITRQEASTWVSDLCSRGLVDKKNGNALKKYRVNENGFTQVAEYKGNPDNHISKASEIREDLEQIRELVDEAENNFVEAFLNKDRKHLNKAKSTTLEISEHAEDIAEPFKYD